MAFDQMTLPNGLRIIGEPMPGYRSVSVGLWLGAGSQYETREEGGLSHFLEHMVFKGTRRRSARQIAEEMDAVGGQLNAFTAKECTCFYTKVVDGDLPLAMDVIADMVLDPAFDPAEMEKEKGVVIEEIAMSEDTPEDLVGEILMLAHYGDQSLAWPILGTEERIRRCKPEELRRYWARMYRPQNAVLSVAGSYDWQQVLALAQKWLGQWSGEGLDRPRWASALAVPGVVTREKDIEQVHISLGYPGLPAGDERNYALSVFNSVYGSAMSSRLYQKIREESGMAYVVYSYPNAYLDTGMTAVYAATTPENADAVLDMLRSEAARMAEDGLTRQEFDIAIKQMKVSYLMGLESTSARMQSIGRRLLLHSTTRTQDEILARIDAITLAEVNDLARWILTAPHSLALVGRDAEAIARRNR